MNREVDVILYQPVRSAPLVGGYWRRLNGDHGVVRMACPWCQRVNSIIDYTIENDGEVRPDFGEYTGCDYEARILLEGWQP